jgi:xanthosine utilization system XapX-like protein
MGTSGEDRNSWFVVRGFGEVTMKQAPTCSAQVLIGLVGVLVGVVGVQAQTPMYWVSPSGAATWANARSVTPLAGAAACSLATANANASAGDTIVLRGGTYNTAIQPAHSGTGIDARIIYQAHAGETPVITGANLISIFLNNGASYIKVSGITVRDVERWLHIYRGSSYNEICYCRFEPHAEIAIRIHRGEESAAPCVHNWFHHNVAYGQGWVGNTWNDEGNIMQIGTLELDGHSGNNTIEDNILYHGGHHIVETWSPYNVVRNNIMHNESWMDSPANPTSPPVQAPASNGKYGNRCLTLEDQLKWARDGVYNLAENNRMGHAGRPPDDDGADVMELAGHKNIVRFNYIYNAAKDGLYFRAGTTGMVGSDNRVYRNTVCYNGQNESHDYYDHRRNGIFYIPSATANVIRDNIAYQNKHADIFSWYPNLPYGNTIENNWLTASGDPLFANPDITDPMSTTLPDLSVRSGSPVIDHGSHLTLALAAGADSTALQVADALYFQDGSWGSALSDVKPDWIAIGSVNTIGEIAAVNYATNTITLATPMTWATGAPVWLYRDSSGRRVLYGNAPDIGAYEVAPDGPAGFVPLPPCRVLDTRDSSGAPVLVADSRRVFAVIGRCGVPADAKAISANLTVVSALAQGDLRVVGVHLQSTMTTSLSIPFARARANNAIVQLATDGAGTIAAINSSSGTVHFILDVNGYFR